jgi:hypothetical protein
MGFARDAAVVLLVVALPVMTTAACGVAAKESARQTRPHA